MAEKKAKEAKAEEQVQEQTAAAQPDAPKVDPIRMSSAAVGEVASFINQKMVESIGKLEYYERAKLAGFQLPLGLTDYEAVKLRDLTILRDSLTSVFFYKRLDEAEAKEIQEMVKKAAEEAAKKQDEAPAEKPAE